jgi:DNA-directed RNA polymerase subunit RPC12/RpoP
MGFWNQIKQQASVLKEKTADKTREWQLQNQINDIRNQIEAKHNTLGIKVYEMYKEDRGDYDSLVPLCEEIDVLFGKISELEEQIEELKIKAGTCPHCQHLNTPDARFCANCGKPLAEADDNKPAPEPEQEPTPAVCPACQAELADEAKFCPHCGHQIQ